MKKLIIATLALLTLSGCFYQVTDAVDIAKAQQECSNRGGIKHIRVDFTSKEVVYCNDGTNKNITQHIVRITKGEK